MLIKTNGIRRCILIVYVNDIILIGDHYGGMSMIKLALGKEFLDKDLGDLKYCLGMDVTWSNKAIYTTQKKYILNFLEDMHVGV